MNSSIIEGLLIGVGVGITSSAILGLIHLLWKLYKRREQVRHLRRCIINNFDKIQDDLVPSDRTKDDPELLLATQRLAIFKNFMECMETTINHRTNALTNNQIFDLQKTWNEQKNFVNFVTSEASETKCVPEGINFYQNAYSRFAEIKWLKLPEN